MQSSSGLLRQLYPDQSSTESSLLGHTVYHVSPMEVILYIVQTRRQLTAKYILKREYLGFQISISFILYLPHCLDKFWFEKNK